MRNRRKRRTETVGPAAVGVSLARSLQGGAAAGAVGGLLMAGWAMVLAALTGYGSLFPFRVVGATLIGDDALVGGAAVVLYGLGLHVAAAVALGTVFGVLSRWTSSGSASLVAGIVYGLGLLLLMNYLVLPIANPALLHRMVLVPGSWFFLHVLYGAGVALAPTIARGWDRGSLAWRTALRRFGAGPRAEAASDAG